MQKSREEWSAYLKGTSSLFASHVPKGYVVTVLARPPLLHSDGLTVDTHVRAVDVSLVQHVGGLVTGADDDNIKSMHYACRKARC